MRADARVGYQLLHPLDTATRSISGGPADWNIDVSSDARSWCRNRLADNSAANTGDGIRNRLRWRFHAREGAIGPGGLRLIGSRFQRRRYSFVERRLRRQIVGIDRGKRRFDGELWLGSGQTSALDALPQTEATRRAAPACAHLGRRSAFSSSFRTSPARATTPWAGRRAWPPGCRRSDRRRPASPCAGTRSRPAIP